MLAFIRRLFSWLGIKVGALFGQGWLVEVAKWTAAKIILTAFISVGIYIIANNLLVWVVSKILEETSQFASQGELSPFVLQLTGLGGYLAGCFKLVQSFSLIVMGFSVRAIRQFLPF